MRQLTNSPELARRFNEDEAVWQRYQWLRALRLELAIECLVPADILDEINWFEAERECRQTRCMGNQWPVTGTPTFA